MLTRYLVDGFEGSVVYFEARHFQTSSGFREGLEDLLSDSSLPPGCRLIIDLYVTDYSPTSADLTDIAASIGRSLNVEGLVGIVVSNRLQYGLARMLEAYLQNLRVATVIFMDKGEEIAATAKQTVVGDRPDVFYCLRVKVHMVHLYTEEFPIAGRLSVSFMEPGSQASIHSAHPQKRFSVAVKADSALAMTADVCDYSGYTLQSEYLNVLVRVVSSCALKSEQP